MKHMKIPCLFLSNSFLSLSGDAHVLHGVLKQHEIHVGFHDEELIEVFP